MESELFVGLDVHTKAVVATVPDREGNRVDQSTLGPLDSQLISYLDRLPGRKHVVLEACSVWEHYFDAVACTDAEVTLAHSYHVRLISEASLKSDKADSESLAELQHSTCYANAISPLSGRRPSNGGRRARQ